MRHYHAADMHSYRPLDCDYEPHPEEPEQWVCTVCEERTSPKIPWPTPPRRNCQKKVSKDVYEARLAACTTCGNQIWADQWPTSAEAARAALDPIGRAPGSGACVTPCGPRLADVAWLEAAKCDFGLW
jgi:hypothetical protein